MSGLFSYATGDSFVHRMNPLVKILLAVGIGASAFLSDNFVYLFMLLGLNLLLGIVGGIGRRAFKLLVGLGTVCTFLFILQLVFIRNGNPVFLFVTDEGLRTAGLVVLRLIDATLPLALVLSLTQVNDLSNALVKTLHVPYRYAFTLTTALRFVPVFMGEMSSIIEAQTARGVDFDTRNPLKKVRMVVPLCTPLLVTSVARIDQAAMAAEMRGFYLRGRNTGSKTYPLGVIDITVVFFAVALIAGGILL